MAFLTGWTKRAPITVSAAQVGAGGVSDFPMLVPMTLPDDVIAGLAYTDGRDLRFTLDDATLLSHELVSIDTVAKTIQAWVKVPSILSSAATTIYAQFGNAAATMPSAAEQQATWNSYLAGWHLQSGSSPFADMGGNYPATAYGNLPNAVAGKIGNAQSLDGTGDYAMTGQFAPPAGAYTVSAWVKPSLLTDRQIVCFSDAYGGGINDRMINVEPDGRYRFYVFNSGTRAAYSTTIAVNAWTYLVGTIDAAAGNTIYVNGVAEGNNPLGTDGYNSYSGSGVLIGGYTAGWGQDFAGLIGHTRTIAVTRTASWILTEYNNQFAPGTFSAWGAVESAGLILPRRFNAGFNAGFNRGVN